VRSTDLLKAGHPGRCHACRIVNAGGEFEVVPGISRAGRYFRSRFKALAASLSVSVSRILDERRRC
jgi:hypothetical protein